MALGRVVRRRRAIARLADRTGGGSLEPFPLRPEYMSESTHYNYEHISD